MPGRPLGGKSSMRGRWQQLFIASDLNLFTFPLFQLQGGGLCLAESSSATITSSTISGNSAVSDFEMRVPVCEVAFACRQVTDGSCVLIFCAGVDGWLLTFLLACRLDGAIPTMSVCEYSVHDMTLRLCGVRRGETRRRCLLSRWL